MDDYFFCFTFGSGLLSTPTGNGSGTSIAGYTIGNGTGYNLDYYHNQGNSNKLEFPDININYFWGSAIGFHRHIRLKYNG